MPDYKEMYHIMFQAAEDAANILMKAQRRCEELYITSPEPGLKIIPLPEEQENTD